MLGQAKALSRPPRAESMATHEVANKFFHASFDAGSGRFHVRRKMGDSFLTNARSRAVTALGVHATTDSDYRRTADVRKVSDPLGTGMQLVALCDDVRRQLDFEIRLTLYDDWKALVVETIAHNTSPKDQLILLEPVRAVYNEGGKCDVSDIKKVLTNGYMYADPGRLQDFLRIDRVSAQSMWNMAFYRDESQEALVIGFLENDMADGRISAGYDNTAYPHNSGAGFGLIAESS
jgi:hypothetical protein